MGNNTTKNLIKENKYILALGIFILLFFIFIWGLYKLYGLQLINFLYNNIIHDNKNYPLQSFIVLANKYFKYLNLASIFFLVVLFLQIKFKLLELKRISERQIIRGSLFILMLLMPITSIKLVLIAVIIVLIKPYNDISKEKIFIGLYSIFSLAYLLAPYWFLPDKMSNKIALLLLLILCSLFWAYYGSGDVYISKRRIDYSIFFILFIILLLINFKTLHIDIPWRGDEASHILSTLVLIKNPLWLIPLLFASLGFALYNKKETFKLGIIIIILTIIFILIGITYFSEDLIRYPFFSRWFFALPVQLLVFFLPFKMPIIFQESLFRIIPFLSVLGIVWFVYINLKNGNKIINILFAIAIGTTPLLFYYSSIQYIEMPAIFLMTIACFDIKKLLHNNYEDLIKAISWYSLILVGFFKEATLPFLVSYLLCRAIIKISNKLEFYKLYNEIKIAILIILPLFTFLYFNYTHKHFHSYVPRFEHLIRYDLYPIIIKSFVDQFGFLLLLFICGCIILLINKKNTVVLFFWVSILFNTIFCLISDLGAENIGYSRWNLFALPPIIAGGCYFYEALCRKKKLFAGIFVVSFLFFNFLTSPINTDGTKKPLWGNPNFDTSEHYYPYRNTISWLKSSHKKDRIRFTGMYYVYAFWFYFDKYSWDAKFDQDILGQNLNETDEISKSLLKAQQEKYSVVVYHILGKKVPELKNNYGYKIEKIFRNKAHLIAVFYNDKLMSTDH